MYSMLWNPPHCHSTFSLTTISWHPLEPLSYYIHHDSSHWWVQALPSMCLAHQYVQPSSSTSSISINNHQQSTSTIIIINSNQQSTAVSTTNGGWSKEGGSQFIESTTSPYINSNSTNQRSVLPSTCLVSAAVSSSNQWSVRTSTHLVSVVSQSTNQR
jgi:hypothetical protein